MDRLDLVQDLAYHQKRVVELQLRLLRWSVTTPEDRNSVREDFLDLKYGFNAMIEKVGL